MNTSYKRGITVQNLHALFMQICLVDNEIHLINRRTNTQCLFQIFKVTYIHICK